MMRTGWGVLAGVLALAACSPQDSDIPDWADGSAWDVQEIESLPVNPDPYLGALQTGYLAQARSELAQYDWADGARYLAKSAAAAEGERVEPLDPAKRGVIRAQDDPIVLGRASLKTYISRPGPMLRAAQEIGKAQVLYDCWVEQTEEGHQTDDIENCRDAFQTTMLIVADLSELPDNMIVVLPKNGVVGGVEVEHTAGNKVTLNEAYAATGFGEDEGSLPVHPDEIEEAFADARGAHPEAPVVFEVYFEFSSTRITDEAHEVIMAVAAEAHRRPGGEVLVSGHADAVGGSATNQAISRRRAFLVAEAVHKELPEAHRIDISHKGHGETRLSIPTARAEEKNRRVVIVVR